VSRHPSASPPDSPEEATTIALVRLIETGQRARGLAEQLEAAQHERDEAILAAWSLGVGGGAIAEKAGITAARVQQIVEASGAAPRRQNRALSRTLEQMAPVPEAHLPRHLINDRDPNQIAVWTMAQHTARTWTPKQLAAEMTRQGWPPDPDVGARLEELVHMRKIHRVGERLYQLQNPDGP
jgi:hypothetical protein